MDINTLNTSKFLLEEKINEINGKFEEYENKGYDDQWLVALYNRYVDALKDVNNNIEVWLNE